MELTVSNTLSRHYRALELAFVWKYFGILLGKGQDNQLNLQNTTVNINLYRNWYLPDLL